MSVGEIIDEAIYREKKMKEFYRQAISEIGPEVHLQMENFYTQQSARIQQLEELKAEVENLRELTAAIAD